MKNNNRFTLEHISGNTYREFEHINGEKIARGRIRVISGEICRLLSAIKIENLKLGAEKGEYPMEDVLELERKTKLQEEVLFGPIEESND